MSYDAFLPVLVPLLPMVIGLVAPGWVRAFPQLVTTVSAGLMLAAAAVLAGRVGDVEAVVERMPWVEALGIEFSLRLDAFNIWFAVLVLGLGGCVMLHAGGYLKSSRQLPGAVAALAGFTLAMLGVVLADGLYLMFVFWEGTSVLSFLLVGFYYDREAVREKASQALLVTLAGGAAMLAGIVCMDLHFGTVSITELLALAGSGRAAELSSWALLLFLLGALTKSAQWPFHFWLPNAMVGPAPVSAFLHSATMVKAGVFLLATLAPLLREHGLWTPLLMGAGLLTVLTAVLRGARERDIKALLACTTLSALGFLTLLAGLGTAKALQGFLVFLTAHALYKCPLFLAAGNLEKVYGTRDVRRLAGAMRGAPVTGLVVIISVLSLVGLAPFPGFIAKEYLLKALWYESPRWAVVAAVAAMGMLGLGWKLLMPMVRRRPRPEVKASLPWAMTVAAAVPAAVTLALVIGLTAASHGLLVPAAVALGAPSGAEYGLWHGWTPAFVLGTAALVGSVGVWRWIFRAELPASLPGWSGPIFEPGYEAIMAVVRGSGAVGGRVLEWGRARSHLALIGAGVGVLAFQGLHWAEWSLPVSELSHETSGWLLLAPVAALAAFLAASARHTLTLLVALGFVGLLVALVYLWFSAPDLALTQLMAETLLLFLLAGVLKKKGVGNFQSGFSWPRAAFAMGGGLLVTMLVLKALAVQWGEPVSDFHLQQSKVAAYGANVVNVILVDFRALDTLGEISVLVIAALGATAAFGAARRRSPLPFDSGSPWLVTATRGLVPFAIPVAGWLFWRGHNAPGGGFIAALVVATAIGLLMLVGDPLVHARRLRHGSLALAGGGLALALVAAVLPLAVGKEFFAGLWWHVGDQHLGTPLLFDLGVFLAVLGFSLGFLRHFQPNRGAELTVRTLQPESEP